MRAGFSAWCFLAFGVSGLPLWFCGFGWCGLEFVASFGICFVDFYMSFLMRAWLGCFEAFPVGAGFACSAGFVCSGCFWFWCLRLLCGVVPGWMDSGFGGAFVCISGSVAWFGISLVFGFVVGLCNIVSGRYFGFRGVWVVVAAVGGLVRLCVGWSVAGVVCGCDSG